MCYRFAPLSLGEVQEALANLRRCGRATFGGRGSDGTDDGSVGAARNDGAPSGSASDGVWGDGRASGGGSARDAYPGARVPVIVCDNTAATPGAGRRDIDPQLQAAVLTWGFQAPRPKTDRVARPGTDPDVRGFSTAASSSSGKLVFNTRLDTAVRQLREGRGMWAQAVAQGRCLVPARAFYERSVPASAGSALTVAAPAPKGGAPVPAGVALAPVPASATPASASAGDPAARPARRAWRFSPVCSGVFLLAGVAQGDRFSIVTTEPNAQVAAVHNRMPLVLGPGESSAWLAGDFDRLADRGAIRLDVQLEGEEPLGKD